jgi:hypothetical protein
VPKRRSLIIIVVFLAFLFFLILTSGSFRFVIRGGLYGYDISGGEGCKQIIIKWRHGSGKLVELCPSSYSGAFGCSRACLSADGCHDTKQIYS